MSTWFGKATGSRQPILTEIVLDVRFSLHVCPDHRYFPVGLSRLEVGGCAIPGEAWIKGVLSSDGKIIPESMAVAGHELAHILNFMDPKTFKNPDEETNE